MLGKQPLLEPDDVCGDPSRRPPMACEPAMRDDVVALGHNELVFVAKRRWRCAHQVEQPFAPWCNMGAVLDIVGRPELLRGRIVALVEERVKGLQHALPVLFRCRLHHGYLLIAAKLRFRACRSQPVATLDSRISRVPPGYKRSSIARASE